MHILITQMYLMYLVLPIFLSQPLTFCINACTVIHNKWQSSLNLYPNYLYKIYPNVSTLPSLLTHFLEENKML